MNHFQNPIVSNSTTEKVIEQELEIKTGPFNGFELDLVLKKLINKNAAELDGITPKIWKTGKFNDLLLYYCNEVYNVIQSWTEGCILPFPRKGNLG